MLVAPKKLKKVSRNEKGSLDQITMDVLKALPPECLEKLARRGCAGGATCLTKFRPIARTIVQLDVKKAFDHVDHRAVLKAMSPFSMALMVAIWNHVWDLVRAKFE